jgi:hypothetical protein
LSETDDTAPGVDYTSYVAMCASELPDAEKKPIMTAIRDRLAPIVASAKDLTVDDRSGVYSTLIEVYEALGDKANADKTAAARLALLEDAAKKAATPGERAVFDAHRLEEYLRAKRYAEAEKMLAATEAAQPSDFNPPWRLAVLYSKQGKTAEGLAAADRALSRGYGARRLRIYSVKVDLLVQKKSWDAARQAISAAKAEIAKMNPKQVRPSWVKELESKLEAIDKAEKTSS